MVRISKRFWCFSLASLCLMIGSTLLSTLAAAQGSNAAHGDKNGSDAGKTKEVKFEVISIRPLESADESEKHFDPTSDGFTSPITARQMIMVAYAPEDNFLWSLGHGATDIRNAPPWLNDGYEIRARVSDDDREAWRNQGREHEMLRSAMQALLKERFKLVIHELPTKIQDYQLVIGKKGPKLKVTPPGSTPPEGLKLPGGAVVVPRNISKDTGEYDWYGATMGDLACSCPEPHCVQSRT
jgi:uncharacterized protein (TIGR03435 family)